MTQMQLNFTFDLGTAEGRAEFQRMCGHLLTSAPQPSLPDEDRLGMPLAPDPQEPATMGATGRANPSSIPDDADRAAAALAGRQAAAAKARAAKAAKAGAAPGPETVIEDPAGPTPNGAVEEDLGLTDPNMSPAEAKEAGLALVREAFQAGKIAQVKALQKRWGVAKFYDIDMTKGHEFYQEVMKMAHEVGLRK